MSATLPFVRLWRDEVIETVERFFDSPLLNFPIKLLPINSGMDSGHDLQRSSASPEPLGDPRLAGAFLRCLGHGSFEAKLHTNERDLFGLVRFH